MSNKKIIIIISILLIAGFIGTSLISFFVSRKSVVNLIKTNELPLTSDNIYSEVQRDLLQPIFISSLMSNDTFLKDWIIHGENDHSKITKYLNEIKTKYNAYTSFFVSEKTLNYYYSEGILKKINPDDERDKWYFRVKEMKNNYEINVDPDMANKDSMTIFINYKVFDYSGNYIGATGVGLNVSAVKQLINIYQNRYSCSIYFVDKKGNIVLHNLDFLSNYDNIKKIKGLKNIAEKVLNSDLRNYTYFNKGKIIHLYTRFIPQFQWHLFVEQTENKAIRGIIITLGINFLICILISMIILFITNITLKNYQNTVEKMAITDKLTGVFNRQTLDINLNQAVKESVRHNKSFSVVILDIDFFKNINDTYGHLAGDRVLCHITDVIKSIIRDSDILSRWGGDEFIMILNNCAIDNALIIAEKIKNAVKEKEIIFENKKISCSISLGVTQFRSTDKENDIVSRADNCLYNAKEKGRGRIEYIL